MSVFFEYPKTALYGRMVPKSKIYEHARVFTKLKDVFVEQVGKITWAYKLAPETINVKSTKSVPEIQVLEIRLKTPDLNKSVLKEIDNAIPLPLIFELAYGSKRKAVAAYKRPNAAGKSKWVISDYLEGSWVQEPITRKSLPVALDLTTLYEKLLEPLIPQEALSVGPLQARIDRLQEIEAQRREVAQLEMRLRKEKQFNKKVGINREFREAKQKLADIVAGK